MTDDITQTVLKAMQEPGTAADLLCALNSTAANFHADEGHIRDIVEHIDDDELFVDLGFLLIRLNTALLSRCADKRRTAK